jgi:hypothetical protein
MLLEEHAQAELPPGLQDYVHLGSLERLWQNNTIYLTIHIRKRAIKKATTKIASTIRNSTNISRSD